MRAALLVALLLVAGASPLAGAACPGQLDVHGRRGVLAPFEDPRASAGAAACVSTPYSSMVDRVLPPGIDEVAAHYWADLGANVTTLNATLDGLGFANATFLLTRAQDVGGSRPSWSYGMPYEALPDGPASGGTLVARVDLPGGGNVTVTFRVLSA